MSNTPKPEHVDAVMRVRAAAGQELPREYAYLATYGYNPKQPRAKDGKWTSESAGVSDHEAAADHHREKWKTAEAAGRLSEGELHRATAAAHRAAAEKKAGKTDRLNVGHKQLAKSATRLGLMALRAEKTGDKAKAKELLAASEHYRGIGAKIKAGKPVSITHFGEKRAK